MNWLNYFAVIMQALPSILQFIIGIENAVGPGQGPAKAALLVDTVQAAVQADPNTAAAVQGHDLPVAVNGIATAVVKGLKATGTFKSSPVQQ